MNKQQKVNTYINMKQNKTVLEKGLYIPQSYFSLSNY